MREEPINYFAVSIQKIEGSEKDYELITSFNPCFAVLTKDEFSQIQYLVDNVVEDVKTILNGRVKWQDIEKGREG